MTTNEPSASTEQQLKSLSEQVNILSTSFQQLVSIFNSTFPVVVRKTNEIFCSQSIYVGDHTALTFLDNGSRIYVDTQSVDIGSHLLMSGTWEDDSTKIFNYLVKPGNTVLDIGANHGFYALHAAITAGPTGKVFAFEPNPRLFRLCKMTMAVNGFSGQAKMIQAAVGNQAGEIVLRFEENFPGGGHVHAKSQPGPTVTNNGLTSVTVPIIKLDDYFSDPSFTVDVIKIDVEGYECAAFEGMKEILRRSPNVKILMEYAPSMIRGQGGKPEELLGLLHELGFRFWSIESATALTEQSIEALQKYEDNSVCNLVASRQSPE